MCTEHKQAEEGGRSKVVLHNVRDSLNVLFPKAPHKGVRDRSLIPRY